MRTVAQRLRTLRAGSASSVPAWVEPEVVDGSSLSQAFGRLSLQDRSDGASLVARLRCRACGPGLVELLERGTEHQAVEAAKALQILLSDDVIEALLEVLLLGQPMFRRQMAAYASMSPSMAGNGLIRSALLAVVQNRNEHDVVRGQALEALDIHFKRGTRRPAFRAILACLSESSPEVVFNAVWAAGALRVRSAVPLLRKLAKSDNRVHSSGRTLAAQAIESLSLIVGGGGPARAVV